MENRFVRSQELHKLFEKNIIANDILSKDIIGVSEVCDCSHFIENKKIEGVAESELEQNFKNLDAAIREGFLWVIELTSFHMSNVLLDEDFYNEFCDKKGNPYMLAKRMALYFDSSLSYWTENIYSEAFEK